MLDIKAIQRRLYFCVTKASKRKGNWWITLAEFPLYFLSQMDFIHPGDGGTQQWLKHTHSPWLANSHKTDRSLLRQYIFKNKQTNKQHYSSTETEHSVHIIIFNRKYSSTMQCLQNNSTKWLTKPFNSHSPKCITTFVSDSEHPHTKAVQVNNTITKATLPKNINTMKLPHWLGSSKLVLSNNKIISGELKNAKKMYYILYILSAPYDWITLPWAGSYFKGTQWNQPPQNVLSQMSDLSTTDRRDKK